MFSVSQKKKKKGMESVSQKKKESQEWSHFWLVDKRQSFNKLYYPF